MVPDKIEVLIQLEIMLLMRHYLVVITGGVDVENSTLIEWLLESATQLY